MSIDRHLIDILGMVADVLGVLGLLYAAYDLFGRRHLKWLIRVLTPALVGAIVLVPAGIAVYAALDFTQLLGRGALIYGMTGVLLGVFNGLFVVWPAVPERPRIFSWRNALTGFLLAFLGWALVSLSIEQSLLASLVESGVLALVSGCVCGIWSFLNWEQSPEREKRPRFSWRGCLLGAVLAYAIGFLADFALGYGYSSTSLSQGALLLPTGVIVGALWPVYKQVFVTLSSTRLGFGKREAENEKPREASIAGSGTSRDTTSLKPPLFSWKGCLFGLVTALLFGFIWAVVANVAFSVLVSGDISRQSLAQDIGGALVGIAFIGPGGAITGGFSRFIFWRTELLQDGQLEGIGLLVTLVSFSIQFVPFLLDYLNIPIH